MGQPNGKRFIEELRQIVTRNFDNEQFGVLELAATYGLSRSQLHKRIKKISGKSVSQFIREVRLQAAMQMLLNEEASVSEIAHRVGFSSPTYFNTCFKDHYGYPPGEAGLRSSMGPVVATNTAAATASILSRPIILSIAVLGTILLGLAGYYIYSNAGDTLGQGSILNDAIPPEKSIAVLPLKNWSGDPDLEYISDGMTEAVISRLSRINAIEKVIPFASVAPHRATGKSLPELSQVLSVNYIVGGSFELAGDKFMIKLQLIDGPNNKQLWSTEISDTWNRDNVFEIQAAVAENIAQNLQVEVTEMEYKEIQKYPTDNIEAYTLFLQAEYLFPNLNESNYEQIISLYQKALELDPDFTEAKINLARTTNWVGWFWGLEKEQDSWKKSKPLLISVIEQDSTNIQAHANLFYGYFYNEWNWAVTEKYYHEGIPGNKEAFKGSSYYSIKTGRADKALRYINEKLAADPSDREAYVQKADALYFAGEEQSSDSVVRNYQVFFTDSFYYLIQTARLHYYLQNHEALEQQLNLLHTMMLKDSISNIPIVDWLDIMQMMRTGDSTGIASAVERLVGRYNEYRSGSPAWFLALYYAAEEEYEQAISWLQKSYERHEVEMTWLREEPLLKPLWNHPRYLEIYHKMGWPMPPNRLIE